MKAAVTTGKHITKGLHHGNQIQRLFRISLSLQSARLVPRRQIRHMESLGAPVVFGLGMTGLFMADQIRRSHPSADYLCTEPFGFENHLIFASINFRREHMEKAIEILADSRYDEIVELIDKDEFTRDPIDAYENKIYCKGAPLKNCVIWNRDYIDEEK